MKRKVCLVSGTRADYGVLRWVMEAASRDPALELQVVATGMHLSPEFGLTYKELEQDGFRLAARVETLLSSDTAAGVAKAVGLGVIGFADAYARLEPDLLVVMGDRFEILAAVQAAFLAGICVAHVSGGEVTEGSQDDAIRHCITKMSHYHFVAAEPYRRRVLQLGEPPECVFNFGDPGLDSIRRLPLLDRPALDAALGIPAGREFLLVTYHPETTGGADSAQGMEDLLAALDAFPDRLAVLTKSNADAGGRAINAQVDAYAAAHPDRVRAVTSLGQLRYLSAMKHCAAVVGNSSSGIVEAPAMRVPTVNIGLRQQGRLRASSVIDCAPDRGAITAAIRRALSPEFRQVAAATASQYGDCDASERIVRKLGEVDVTRHRAKRFHDLPA
jgi:UDP-hydrolysing UDP-N-acetyl-D-glucosamine 2-epimerase